MARTVSAAFPITSFNNIPVKTNYLSSSANYYSYTSRWVEYIAIHYTGNSKDLAKSNASFFSTGSRGASAHYFVDETSCYQSVALHNAAWAVGGTKYYKHSNARNKNSISIEMCCSGNSRVSEKTKNNTAHLTAALCRYLGITANQVDTYVIRHFDVWSKQCPAQMATNPNAEWNAFKEQVKKILRNQPLNEEELTMSQYTELKDMINNANNRINKLEAGLKTVADYAGVKYRYVDGNLPEWAHNVMTKLCNAGIVKGDGDGFAMSQSDIRILTILDRVGAIDNNMPYHKVEDVPGWGQDVVKRLVKAGVILGNSDDDLGITMETLKVLVYCDRAGLLNI